MEILKNHPLAQYSTYRIGGPADYFLEATTSDELVEGLKWAETAGIPTFVLGGGSNVLFDDDGFRGLVIRMRMNEIKIEELDGAAAHDSDCARARIAVDAGVPMAVLVRTAAENGLTGIEEWTGLPGTVGGAVRGNAGCFGVEIKDVLEKATIYAHGGIQEISVEDLEFDYRTSLIKKKPGIIVLRAAFLLRKSNPETVRTKMSEIAKLRAQKQPPALSAGSFFKNPPAPPSAGQLIDSCGLKGKIIGKAQISPVHGNFLINLGGASSKDILALAQIASDSVLAKFGIKLEREVAVLPTPLSMSTTC